MDYPPGSGGTRPRTTTKFRLVCHACGFRYPEDTLVRIPYANQSGACCSEPRVRDHRGDYCTMCDGPDGYPYEPAHEDLGEGWHLVRYTMAMLDLRPPTTIWQVVTPVDVANLEKDLFEICFPAERRFKSREAALTYVAANKEQPQK